MKIHLKKSLRAQLIVVFALACFSLSPTVRAVDPPPDGGYPGGNTAEGEDALHNLTDGVGNTAIGYQALYSITDSSRSTAIGYQALSNSVLFQGGDNTAVGYQALFSNFSGFLNTAIGRYTLYSSTNGVFNTAIGDSALYSNTSGYQNTAIGGATLYANTTGAYNVAFGVDALFANTSGSSNTAIGTASLAYNTTGFDNTAAGVGALASNAVGNSNTADGVGALAGNTQGNSNTANGTNALSSNRRGNYNTAIGVNALGSNINGYKNMATGVDALGSNTTGSLNIALGTEAGANLTTGSNNIDIGNRGVAGEANTIRIGCKERHANTFIAGINGVTIAEGVGVIIDAKGHLGTFVSSEHFKTAIKPMDNASEAVLALKPVSFRYKKGLDPKAIPQFGLIAEQVEKVNPDLVTRDEKGRPYSVRYEAVNAMLLNEFLKEHRKNEEQQATIAQLKSGMEALTATVKEQAAQIQKVSAQLEANKPVSQLVNNP